PTSARRRLTPPVFSPLPSPPGVPNRPCHPGQSTAISGRARSLSRGRWESRMSNVTEPVILPLPTPWDVESAARRIAQLETALMRRHELLEQKQAALDAIYESGAWKAVRLYYKVREKLLPLHSRRRRLLRTALRVGLRTVRRLTGQDLASLAAGGDG